jgi:hypothetical protein
VKIKGDGMIDSFQVANLSDQDMLRELVTNIGKCENTQRLYEIKASP